MKWALLNPFASCSFVPCTLEIVDYMKLFTVLVHVADGRKILLEAVSVPCIADLCSLCSDG